MHRDADARLNHEFVAIEIDRLRDRLQYFSRHQRGGGAVRFGQQHNEFVTALTCHRIVFTQASGEPQRGFAQQCVAGMVAERIVDIFEAVQIDKQHRQRFAFAVRGGQHLLQPVVQQGAIG